MSEETKTPEADEHASSVSLKWWASQAITEFVEGALKATVASSVVGGGITTQSSTTDLATLVPNFLLTTGSIMCVFGYTHFRQWHNNHHLPNLFGVKP